MLSSLLPAGIELQKGRREGQKSGHPAGPLQDGADVLGEREAGREKTALGRKQRDSFPQGAVWSWE